MCSKVFYILLFILPLQVIVGRLGTECISIHWNAVGKDIGLKEIRLNASFAQPHWVKLQEIEDRLFYLFRLEGENELSFKVADVYRLKAEEKFFQTEKCLNDGLQEHNGPQWRLLLYLFLVVFSFWGILFIGFFFYWNRKNEKRISQLRMELNLQRLLNIRNRISPHFVFNILSHEASLCSDTEKSEILTLVQLIRRNLTLTDKICVSLVEELEFVDDYLELERRTLGDDFSFRLEVDKGIDLNKIILPSMSIQLLIENAVKHALSLKEGQRKLWLYVSKMDRRIIIRLIDNGGGFKSSRPAVGTGTGLWVLSRMIQLFNQYNREPILMDIRNVDLEEAEVGCSISYSIPQDYSFRINNK